jgi:Ni/Fe-hydrogenase subunit HybB-like protein
MTLLSFYQRIFTTKQYRRISRVVMAMSTAWVIGAILGNIFNCHPVNHFWNRLEPGSCMNFNNYAVATGVAELLIDITILALPTRTVFTLQMPLRTKIVLASIFMLGGL